MKNANPHLNMLLDFVFVEVKSLDNRIEALCYIIKNNVQDVHSDEVKLSLNRIIFALTDIVEKIDAITTKPLI